MPSDSALPRLLTVDAATARSLAFARDPDEAALIDRPLPSSGGWNLYLGAAGACFAVPFATMPQALAPHAGDA